MYLKEVHLHQYEILVEQQTRKVCAMKRLDQGTNLHSFVERPEAQIRTGAPT
jgi:hypothetical protein